MALVIIWILILFVLVLVGIRIAMEREKIEDTIKEPVIHASGVYSVARRSPRDHISEHKPAEEEIRKYLDTIHVDHSGSSLGESDKETLVKSWNRRLEESLQTVENGDREAIEFYYFEFEGDDGVCAQHALSNGKFISRKEIHKHPQILPPFHLGCRCRLETYKGKENLRETKELGMYPLFGSSGELPTLPDWKQTLKP